MARRIFTGNSLETYAATLKANMNNPSLIYDPYLLKRITPGTAFNTSYVYSSNAAILQLGGLLLFKTLSFLTDTDNYMKINYDSYGGSRPIEGYDQYGNPFYKSTGGTGSMYYDENYKPLK